MKLSRRYAFRYVKITVERTNVPIRLADMNVRAVTSADYSKCEPVDTEDALLQQIDRTAQKTLADCM